MKVLLSALALGAIALVFVFHPFTPAFPRAGIDPSWVAVMGEAADRPARWGVDTVFTYGPASPLVTGYVNAAFLTRTLPLQVGFALLFGWCGALLVAAGRSAALGTASLGLMLMAARGTPDALFLTLPVLVLLVSLQPGRTAGLAAPLGAAALGLTAMVKMSFPLAALPLLLLADGAGLLRRRRPRLLPCFALGIGAGALLYGQRLSDLPAYAVMQGEVVAGYAAAMGMEGPDWDILPFLVLAVALVALTALAERRDRPHREAVAVPSGLAVGVFFLFKAGFIRHDLHSLIAWTGLALVGTALAWNRLPRRAALAVTAVACSVVLAYEPVLTVRQSVREGRAAAFAALYRGWLVDDPAREIAAAAEALGDAGGVARRLAVQKAAAWAEVAAAAPLAPLPGTVDILPSEQTRVMAAGLNYRGRPSFQEYSTYAAGLAAVNRAFVQGPEGPRWMLFGPESPFGEMAIDGRFPGFAEGTLWPDLLRLYRPHHRIGALAALERRAAPLPPLPLGTPRRVAAGFGDWTAVTEPGPVWATLDLRPSLLGRALSLLFRPPVLTLAVRRQDGGERRFRLVPDLAAAGFLLSPLVDNASDYEMLAAGRPAPAGRRVTGVAVEVSGPARLAYAPDIAVTLRTLDTSSLAEDRAAPPSAWDALAGAAEQPEAVRIAAPASGLLSLPLWRLPAAGGMRRVTLDYGTEGGACFAIHPADGTRGTLWRRCIDPALEGHGPWSVSLDVPEAVGEIVLEGRGEGASWRRPASR